MDIIYIIRIVLGLLLFPSFFILFFALVIAKINKDDGLLFIDFKNASRTSKRILYVILGFIFHLILFLTISIISNRIFWNDKLDIMKNYNYLSDRCYINDSLIQDPSDILKSLQGYKGISPNHTHPDKKIEIRLEIPNKSVMIYVFRDSYHKDRYWIIDYQKKYNMYNEVGIIETKTLNGF